ncbi:MAG: hypothetical protein KJ999_21660 [Gammaproteobacteria bacterium]|nr:hypothetical protein [Gammaproteobacteria bacterium]
MIELGVDKGILVKIPGDDIGAGVKMLPPASAAQPPELSVVVDTPNFGQVRIKYRLNKSPRRMSGLWFWTACYAAAVLPDATAS